MCITVRFFIIQKLTVQFQVIKSILLLVVASEMLAKKPLTFETLSQLYGLTQFENLMPRFTATVPPCWTEMQQEQQQRRHPQHLQHQGEATQHTRSWKLQPDRWVNWVFIRPKKNPVFRATRPYLSEPAVLDFFLRKYRFFFIGVFIIEVSILKKTKQKKHSWPYLKFLRPLP